MLRIKNYDFRSQISDFRFQIDAESKSHVSNLISQISLLKSHISHLTTHYPLLIAFLCCISISASAQTKWSYLYDNAGNRLNRAIIDMTPPPTSPPPQDSIETFIEGSENPIASVQDPETVEEKSQEVYTDVLAETLITIYPNPTAGLLTVKISELPQHSVSSLTLFDMHGRVITQQQSLADENRLDISAQPVGTYIMQVAVGTEVTSWKIVKR